jgi:hypothetical protein
MTSLRDMFEGEEVVVSYGVRSDNDYLRRYGFIPDGDNNDSLNDVVFKLSISPYDALADR